ncbi:PREDICTED: tetratricopeptide repeat protein 27 homolog [Nelumbo nucifera]|uniref:Tetratricopeptide repeat protein 27 homolog n=2 Tax=Nelumbo nucifera TaxID=4432 RepID=A0A1U7ZTD1_NELNU|nr:PREDICTED: tetratricopeptide repeat protein 27 homolog [Nelumbo nucifera]DAD38703.1 TPA_asm: hypothetical protein HUJ06_013025 [Nelumbo nucifera]
MAEAAPLEALREFELRLLLCSLSSASTETQEAPRPLPSPELIGREGDSVVVLLENVVNCIEKGDYAEALFSDAARLIFEFAESWEFEDSIDCADRFYCEVEKSVQSFLELENDFERSCRELLVMCIGVAAFLSFTQCNVTGPSEGFHSFPLPFWRYKDDKTVNFGVEWDMWARNQLMSTGSELLGKFSIIQYMVYAKMLLVKIKDLSVEVENYCLHGCRSISWWLSRLFLLQQRILDDRSSSLFDLLQVLMRETLQYFGDLGSVTNYWGNRLLKGDALTIVSAAHLEAGIIEHAYGRVDSSRQHINTAEESSGLQLSVTGVLGFRTIHQVEAKAQMVLLANTSMPKSTDTYPQISPESLGASVSDETKASSHSHDTHEASDILMVPKLLENEDLKADANGRAAAIPLEAIQQAVILARCLLIEKSARHDEMQAWEMAPFIEAIDAQQFKFFIIQCFCDILRIRWESSRSRTKQRALMMMDELVQSVFNASPAAAQRIYFSYAVYIPTIPALRKEYGELLVSCGMIGEAITIFEDLELWDNLIYCYCLLKKKAAAVELIKTRLTEMPNDPRLWCSLGDVTNNDDCYRKALEVSNDRSARAKRSLARSAYNRGDYEASKVLWEYAMALNSLYPDGWFALGAAALKARDIEKAVKGFTHAVQLDPENGEAWNNIACLHMMKKKSKEAFIAFKEALKFRRNSWQLWENYSQVAVDIGNFGQALEATKMVLDMTGNKRIDAKLLERIIVEMEERTSGHFLSSASTTDECNCQVQALPNNSIGHSVPELEYSESGMERSRETEHLLGLLGKVLQQVVRSGSGEDLWGLYARWHKIKGDLTMCAEALLKQVRAYQGADLWSNRERFKKFAHASWQLCKVYIEISSSTKSCRELIAAEMHLKNTVKLAVSFSDTEEFRDLQTLLEEVKEKLESTSVPSTGNS